MRTGPLAVLQSIAPENTLTEIAFVVPRGGSLSLLLVHLAGEMDFCWHATLAAAHAIPHQINRRATAVRFETKSGLLALGKWGDLCEMDFRAYELSPYRRRMP